MHLAGNSLWLRWSWRDLRRRWVQVVVIALVAAVGSGTYVGLTSTSQWRRLSYDASFAALDAHTLKVTLGTIGTKVPTEQLTAAPGRMAHPEWVAAAEPQLVVPTQVDASRDGRTILVPGRLVGVDVSGGGPEVDRFDVRSGRGLTESDTGTAVIDYHFGEHHQLPPSGTVKLSGGRDLPYVGQVLQPDYFMILGNQGGLMAEAGYAVLFVPLADAQAISGSPGQANQLVVRLVPGADPAAAKTELEAALAVTAPGAAVEVTPITEERAYRLLYDDIEGDQRFYRIFAVLIMVGAAFAAFNLATRIVEAQRREIGVGMALGVPPRWLALRPLLVGFQVALLGMVFGVAVGVVVGSLMAGVMKSFFPLPVWLTPFQFGTYLIGSLAGVLLVFLATVYPVVRAVRVAPIDAITVGARGTKSSGWARLLRRLPGDSLVQMPVRNALRSPRRSLLTALGIAAAIATLIAVLGMVDSFLITIDKAETELLRTSPDRLEVSVDGFQLAGSPALTALREAPGVAATSENLRVTGEASRAGTSFEAVIDVVDFNDPVWAPSVIEGSTPGDEPSVVISRKAAEDLHVGPGGVIRLRHPYREGLGYRWVETDLEVAGIHAVPYRFLIYLDRRHASVMNLAGVVNYVHVKPEAGASSTAVQRTLFGQPGVASVEPIAEVTRVIRDLVNEVLDVLDIIKVAVLALAVLIAFNSSSISADERARENATMFAFGLRPRTTLAMSMAESGLLGIVATAMGIAFGVALLGWIVRVLLADTMPDLWVTITVQPSTYLLAALLGVLGVALAPVFTLRKLRRMPIPETLRVVE